MDILIKFRHSEKKIILLHHTLQYRRFIYLEDVHVQDVYFDLRNSPPENSSQFNNGHSDLACD
jgi:hypothetical protein